MSVSSPSPVRESVRLVDDKTEMVSPTESSGRLEIPGALLNLRKDLKPDDNKEEVRKELEMFNMKELMLIHLDYIQQQSEVAQIKDKLIADLEHQVETLKQRLHRMTRRVSLNKSRSSATGPAAPNGVSSSKSFIPSNSSSTAESGAHRPSVSSVIHSSVGPVPLPRKRRLQSSVDGRHSPTEESSHKKLFKSKKELRPLRTPSESSKNEPDRSVLVKLKEVWTTPETYTTIVGETESAQRWVGSSAADVVTRHTVQQQNVKASLEVPIVPLTSIPFVERSGPHNHKAWGGCVAVTQQWGADSRRIWKREGIAHAADFGVPKWRIHCYAPIYSMEGTENLSDDVYERRHGRLASDEKRRKRWDVQRIREQRQIERLREKEEARKKARDESSGVVETNSFWPEPTELGERLTLCVADEVPIGFCGINLLPPSKEDTEFSLPWKNGGCEQTPLKSRRRGKR